MCLVTWSCPILCDPMDCSPTRLPCPWRFSRQEYWSGLPCPPGDLPNPGIKPRSPTLQADSLPSEPPGKPKNTAVGILSYPFSRGSFLPRNQTGVSCIAGGRWSWVRLCPTMTSMCGPGQVTSCFFNLFPTHKMGRLIPCFCKIHHQFINFLYKRE